MQFQNPDSNESEPVLIRNEQRPDIWPFWPTIGFSSLIFTIFLMAQTVIAVMFGVYYALKLMPVSTDDILEMTQALTTNGLLLAVATIVAGILGTMAILLFIKIRKNITVKDYLGFHPLNGKTVIILIVTVLVLLAGLIGAGTVIDESTDSQFTLEAYKNSVYPVLFWIAVVIFAPLFEELFFRGFLFVGLQYSVIGPIGATLITAILWAMLHLQYDIFGLSIILVLGIVFGVIRYITKSIWSTLILHSSWNLLQMIILALSISGVVN